MKAYKEKIRDKLRQQRLGMKPSTVAAKSDLIVQHLIQTVDWNNIKSLHTYTPLQKLNEVDTRSLLDYLQINWPQINVTIQSKSQKLPDENFQRYDLIIVPTLAFDNRGFRLGWGGGFYDRFLAAQPQAQKVGLCFSKFGIEKIPDEPHDIRLDLVITENTSVE